MERRDFIKGVAGAGILASLGKGLQGESGSSEMIYRTLGHTGERVSAIGVGGWHIGHGGLAEEEGIRIIRTAIDRGITFLDNCWDYNGGESEIRMGKALRDGYRQKAFLMTKIDGRGKEEAARQIDESLRRLQTDHIDLMQHHEVIRFEDPDRIFAKGGAQEAMLEAKKAGKVRYIGFTGHKDPRIHLYMLEIAEKHGFLFDAVQMPLNVMDAHYRSFAHMVLPKLVEKRIGVLGMKTFGGGAIVGSNTATPAECLRYSLNLPTSVVITGMDSTKLLDQAFTVASTFRPMGTPEVAAILAKTKEAAADGQYEGFKTSSGFDGTAHHVEWLGADATPIPGRGASRMRV